MACTYSSAPWPGWYSRVLYGSTSVSAILLISHFLFTPPYWPLYLFLISRSWFYHYPSLLWKVADVSSSDQDGEMAAPLSGAQRQYPTCMFEDGLTVALRKISRNHLTLKPEQISAIQSAYEYQDVFVWLPTGFGKSLVYECLPLKVQLKVSSARLIAQPSPFSHLLHFLLNVNSIALACSTYMYVRDRPSFWVTGTSRSLLRRSGRSSRLRCAENRLKRCFLVQFFEQNR